MTDVTRRAFMGRVLATGGALITVGTLSYGTVAWAASDADDESSWHFAKGWPRKAYDKKKVAAAMHEYFGTSEAAKSKKVKLDVPEIAENGAVVPITISTDLPKVTKIAVFVPKNPYAMTVAYQIPTGTEPFVSNRIKMANGSDIIAVVESDGKLYKTSKFVKVTVGGCGG
jgi:sulfur-oxidizing protein SoxY